MSGFRQEDIEMMEMGPQFVVLLFIHFVGMIVVWYHW
jgi:hypothetical protein